MQVSTRMNSHTHWHSLLLTDIALNGGFWLQKQAINRQVSLRQGYEQLERAGNLDNLRLAAGLKTGEYRGPVFMDSDVYKWLEALAYDLAIAHDAQVERMADEVIGIVACAQKPDGYLNSYYQHHQPDLRWTDLDHGHELYCAGHLFEAAVAMHRATGDERLLDVAQRFADHVDTVFGRGRRRGAPGHPEIELALVELYRETGERRYLDLASFFIDERGAGRMRGHRHYGPEYHQDQVAVRQATVVEGHAVRQLYLTAGATDAYIETGDATLLDAMERLWQDMTTRKMHVTAGFGARFSGEAFGEAYELPADRCYCETCASIASMMWNWRMLLATGEPRYADLLERSLYNGFASGVSLDGRHYFYVNPLQSHGGVQRPEWYGCACCPPNVMRQIAMVTHYAATAGEDGVQIHQYMPATIRAGGNGGPQATLRVETGYPWEGRVRVRVEETDGSAWALKLRLPGWCTQATLAVNRDQAERSWAGGQYATLTRAWQAGDLVELDLSMTPVLIEPNPRVDAIRASLCIQRGPIIYCLEQADQPDLNLLDVRIRPDSLMEAHWHEGLLGGVVTIQVEGQVVALGEWQDHLYLPAADRELAMRKTTLTAVPYYAWANRESGSMRVWIPTE